MKLTRRDVTPKTVASIIDGFRDRISHRCQRELANYLAVATPEPRWFWLDHFSADIGMMGGLIVDAVDAYPYVSKADLDTIHQRYLEYDEKYSDRVYTLRPNVVTQWYLTA